MSERKAAVSGKTAAVSEAQSPLPRRPKVGLALGSGSARGWAHIGIIQALEERGVEIDVVAGTSIGALVGGAYVSGALNEFGDWVRTLTTKDVFSLMDFTLSGGGMVKGEKRSGSSRSCTATRISKTWTSASLPWPPI